MTDKDSAEILVKFEAVNIGGSIKTRTAYNMILAAERAGLLNKDSIIVEPTSGNQGIGLALVCAVRGYPSCGSIAQAACRRWLREHFCKSCNPSRSFSL